MKTPHLRLQSLLLLSLLSCPSHATSLVISTDLSMSGLLTSSERTAKISSSLKDDKIVLAARTDAAAFVASDGAIRGVQLESALQRIRQAWPESRHSDAQLAAAILSL